MEIKFLFAQNANIQGKALHFEADEIFDAPEEDALRLIEGLCAEAVTKKPPKKSKKEVTEWPEEPILSGQESM